MRSLTIAIAALLVFSLLIAGCVGNTGAGKPGPVVTGSEKLSIKVSGSTTVLPIAQQAAEKFMASHINADIQVSAGGSGVGIQNIGDKTVDIGMSSRELKTEEIAKYPELVPTKIAYDGMAIIVHPSNTISSITIAQVRDIYAGNVTNWKSIGGPDKTIVVIGRDSTSGTRDFFTTSIMGSVPYVKTQQELNSNGAIQQAVSQTPGAIGYVGLGYLSGVKALPVNVNGTTIEPTVGNVLSGKYPLSRPLYMITNGQPSGLARQFIDYILSPEGQGIVRSTDYVPLP
jgi:phosphate transport system substrate-binding protein